MALAFTPDPDAAIRTGSIELSAPEHILDEIILPIVKIAVRVGGVGRGWRRPLHIVKNRARGCYVRSIDLIML